jgi:hypothetical protein
MPFLYIYITFEIFAILLTITSIVISILKLVFHDFPMITEKISIIRYGFIT